MELLKVTIKRIVLIIIMISILITFLATPSAYAKLDLEEGDFYYSGTTKGTYLPSISLWDWILNALADIADFLLAFIVFTLRMPIIGWTALLEKLLTWALESTMGVSADGSLVQNSNDLTGLSDSSGNVTVESIVYNKVAGLNIDIFELEYDRTRSGTGQKLMCDKCEKFVDEKGRTKYKTKPVDECVEGDEDPSTYSIAACGACECKGCDACTMYINQLSADDPLFIKLRKFVATWYGIIMMLALAIMLVVLIGIGIKMAISTIASDKAVYKRMLVDWIVGLIMIFTLHYFMIFAINLNGTIVNTIADSANAINQVQMKQLSEEESDFTNSDVEIKVYEEIRTRAYDPQLKIGLVGTIMYMSLVFLAFKYTLIYLKRLLTIIVLTLMAPGIGVAYALQKALTGKSQAFKTWMTEYIMTIIIQIVHALMYAIFISQALVLSLQSVSGIVIALVLMNYTSKADKLFKKIFKLQGNDGVSGSTENASEDFKKNMQTAMGIATGAKPVAKMLANTPATKALKAVGKGFLAAGVGAAHGISNWREERQDKKINELYNQAVDEEMEQSGGAQKQENETPEAYNARRAAAEERLNQSIFGTDENQSASQQDGNKLAADVEHSKDRLAEEADNPSQEAKDEHLQATQKYNEYKKLRTPTLGTIAKGHLTRIVSMENVFTTKKPSSFLGKAFVATFGNYHWDRKNLKLVNDGNGVYNQFTLGNLLGLSDEETKELKAYGGDLLKGIGGMFSIVAGMGAIVTNPKVGMGLLVGGASSFNKVFGRNPNIATRSGRYTFNRFSSQSIDSMRNTALAKAKREHNALLAAEIEAAHPGFSRKLKIGAISAVTLGAINITGAAIPAALLGGGAAYMGARFFRNSKAAGRAIEFNRKYNKQIQDQIAEFNAEADDEQKTSIDSNSESNKSSLRESEREKEEKERAEMLEKELEASLAAAGYKYNKDTGVLTVVSSSENGDVTSDEIVGKNGKSPNSSDIALINKEIDLILQELSAGKELDMTSKKVQGDVLDKLEARLEATGVLEKGQKVGSLFKEGETGVINAIKRKTDKKNEVAREAAEKLEDLFPEEAEAVVSTVAEMQKEALESGRDFSEVTASDVFSRLDSRRDGSVKVEQTEVSKDAIRDFLQVIQAGPKSTGSQISGKKAKEIIDNKTKEAEKIVTEKVDEKREERNSKLQQALALMAEVPLENENSEQHTPVSSDDVLRQLLAQKGQDEVVLTLDSSGTTETYTKAEARYLIATARDIEDMKKLNDTVLRRDLEVRDGTRGYWQKTSERSKLSIELAKLEKEKIQSTTQRSPEDTQRDARTKRSPEEIQRDIESKRAEIAKVEKDMRTQGPAIDIKEFISSHKIYDTSDSRRRR